MPDESPTEAKRDQHIDRMLDAITAAVPPLLSALEALAHVGRYLHPPHVAALAESAAGAEQPLIDGMKRFRAVSWPARLLTFTVCVEDAADHACEALQRLRETATAPDSVLGAYPGHALRDEGTGGAVSGRIDATARQPVLYRARVAR